MKEKYYKKKRSRQMTASLINYLILNIIIEEQSFG